VATYLDITFDIKIGILRIPSIKLQEVLSLCNFYISKSKISQQKLQALIDSLMFLHKAIKPGRIFVNHILALLQEMGKPSVVVIDEGFHRDFQWFIACARAFNGSITIYKSVQPQLDIFVDASVPG
jgi:hypothetical protein